MPFPNVKFGLCELCGGGGTSSLGTVQESGYELKEYDGKWLCQICINILEDEKSDEVRRENDVEEQNFRQGAGMTRI